MIQHAVITQEDNWVVAKDRVSGIASQGKTEQEAITNLKEAVELYREENEDMKNRLVNS